MPRRLQHVLGDHTRYNVQEGWDPNDLLHPAQAFEHPSRVVYDPDLTLNEKRAILASWASDAWAPEASLHSCCAPGGKRSFQIQNGANDQSSACETIFEVSPTSVLVLLGSCQSRLQREWA